MDSSALRLPPPAGQAVMAPPATMIKELVDLSLAGRWDRLELQARALALSHPGLSVGWIALSTALLKLERWEAALEPLARVSQLAPEDADACNDLGFAFCKLGRWAEAEASYRLAIGYRPRFAQAYNNLGVLLSDLGRLAEASVHLKRSREIDPEAAGTHSNLGCALRNLGLWSESAASYRRALALNPDSVHALHGLGILLQLMGEEEEAVSCLERSLALDPCAMDACVALANLLLSRGEAARAMPLFRRAQELRPLITRRASREPAEFSVLLLDAPGPGNTPISYLVGRASYDCHFYCVIPDAHQDLDFLRGKADVVVNLIADADNGRESMPELQDLVERLGRPTVNRPGLIPDTGREVVARRLAGIPFCRIPKTRRFAGPELAQAARHGHLKGFTPPLLVRLAGNHGGDEFERVDELTAIADFVARHPAADYYLTEYAEYRSADGFYRKYRLICIDGALYPYHLAIHTDWKVHHFRTDLATTPWMRREEESFLKDPQLVFDAPRQAALRTVAATTGLDYCGIDCALDRNGEIVVFEANATMLVHDEKEALFAYKNPFVADIKAAFDAMLSRMNGVRAKDS